MLETSHEKSSNMKKNRGESLRRLQKDQCEREKRGRSNDNKNDLIKKEENTLFAKQNKKLNRNPVCTVMSKTESGYLFHTET
jgi:hypothetical protein